MISNILELSKIRITFFVTVSTVFGYLCARGFVDMTGVFTAAGIFFIACASSVINHLQEIPYDLLMKRTSGRPLPKGRVSKRFAILLATGLFLAGGIILLIAAGAAPFLLGVLAMVFYNLIYTPLKRVTHLAVLPGAIIGAIPPVAGWVSGGGSLADPKLLLIAFFFFIWQLPHFWLLLLLYRKDYESAGYPTLFKRFGEAQVKRMTFIYTAVTGLSGLLFPLFSLVSLNIINISALGLAFIALLMKSIDLLRKETGSTSLRFLFGGINLYVLVIVLIVSIDKIVMLF